MAGEENLPDVPRHEAPDRVNGRPSTFGRDRVHKENSRPENCAIQFTVSNDLLKTEPLPPKPPLGPIELQQIIN